MATPFTTAPTAPASLVVPATDKQVTLIAKLLGERDWTSGGARYVARTAAINIVIAWALAPMEDYTPPEVSRVIHNTVGRISTYGERINAIMAHLASKPESANLDYYAPLSKQGASKLIELLMGLVARETPAGQIHRLPGEGVADVMRNDIPSVEVVPAGRYAVDTEDSAVNTVAFYKVDRPTEGRWAGKVFVKLLISDGEQRLSWATSRAVLNKIAEVGAEAASARYGHEIGRCGVCDRTLTNDASRARGIGPVCAENAGW